MTEGNEDEPETPDTADRSGQDHQGHSQSYAQAILCGRKDPHCAGRILRGEETIAELCRREGIAQSIYYK